MKSVLFLIGNLSMVLTTFGQQHDVVCGTQYYDVVVDEFQSGPVVFRGDLPLTGMIEHSDFDAEYCLERWSNFLIVEYSGKRLQQVVFEPGTGIPKLSTYYYTDSGKPAMIVPFKNGKIHGLVYTYHSDGDCLTIMTFRRGRFLGYNFYWGQMDKDRLRTINSNVEGNPLTVTTVIR